MSDLRTCPHCGKPLLQDSRTVYAFSWWASIAMVTVISLMLFMLDFIDDGQGVPLTERFVWSGWTVLGVWVLYISAQLIRYQPYYRWFMVPISGILLSLFFAGLDRNTGDEGGLLGMQWSWYVIIPLITFVVVLPIIVRLSYERPSHRDRLEHLVESLERTS